MKLTTRAIKTTVPPEGLIYLPNFISEEEEEQLISSIEADQFQNVVMHGVVAKRTVIHYGYDYGYDSWKIEKIGPFPDWMMSLRNQAAEQAGLMASSLEQVLIANYPIGAAIGWHRDAPMFGPTVLGISLVSAATMKFRRTVNGQREIFSLLVEPRSFYQITGKARSAWQHSLVPVTRQRYSITFRTVRESFKTVRDHQSENLVTS